MLGEEGRFLRSGRQTDHPDHLPDVVSGQWSGARKGRPAARRWAIGTASVVDASTGSASVGDLRRATLCVASRCRRVAMSTGCIGGRRRTVVRILGAWPASRTCARL
jgi:hypothetical protein